MSMARKLGVLIPAMAAAMFLIAAPPVLADDKCALQPVASLDMTVDSTGRISVPMSFAGKTENMLIDTGSTISLLTADTAKSLGLEMKDVHSRILFQFFGGAVVTQYVTALDIALGQMVSRAMDFAIFPEGSSPDTNGILGENILSSYDLDLDFANSKLNLFSTDHCPGQVVYWTSTPVAVVPFSRDRGDHILFDATLDGKNIQALVDTGAYRSVANWETVGDAFGLTETSSGVTREGEGDHAVYTYPFKTFTFGGVTVNNPDITMAPRTVSRIRSSMLPPVILGINVLRRLHIYVAAKEGKLYITPASAH